MLHRRRTYDCSAQVCNIMEPELMLPKSIRDNQAALLEICFAKQGEYRRAGEPDTSWSTRYGADFIEAAAYLFLIHSRTSSYPEYAISAAFIGGSVLSCRGAKMDHRKVLYLIENHLRPFLAANALSVPRPKTARS